MGFGNGVLLGITKVLVSLKFCLERFAIAWPKRQTMELMANSISREYLNVQ